MQDLNTITLSGRLTADPVSKDLAGDKSVTTSRLAINLGKDKASFVGIEVWNGSGAAFASRLGKGSPVIITGRLVIDEYQTAEGERRSATKIQVDSWRALAGKAATGDSTVSDEEPLY